MKRLIFATLLAFTCLTSVLAQKAVVWDNPAVEYAPITSILKVTKVEMNDKATTMSFHFTLLAEQQMEFTNNIILQADGKDYKATDISVMKFDEVYTMPASGMVDFTMTFAPLPLDTKSITFNMPGAFNINNIHNRNAQMECIDNTYWRNEKTGDWMIGFADGKVIYDCQLWDITSQNENKGAYTIAAVSGTQQINISISKEKKGKRTITIGKDKMECSIIQSEFLPDYPSKDTESIFADNHYQPVDSVTIVGWYKDMPKELYNLSHEFSAAAQCMYTDEEKTFSTPMDSLGRFTLRMPMQNTQGLYCDWDRSNVMFVAEPGETYFLLKDFTNGNTLVMGKNARLMNELLAHRVSHSRGNYQRLEEHGDIMGYLAYCDSLKTIAMQNLEQTMQQHPTLSSLFETYSRNEMLTAIGSSMMQGRFRIKGYKLPAEFTKFVKSNYWDKIQTPYSAYENDFTTFFRDYTQNMVRELQEKIGVPLIYALHKADDHGRIALSGDDKTMIDEYKVKYDELMKNISEASDSLREDFIVKFNSSVYVKNIDNLLEREGVRKAVEDVLNNLDYEIVLNAADSLGWSQDIVDIYFTQNFSKTINGIRQPLQDEKLAYFDKIVKSDYAKSLVHELNNKYIAISQRSLSTENLKSADDVKGMSEGAQILSKLTEPYRGHLILLDIWGTWCSPCKQALSHSQEEYEQLKPYNLVYMYLADSSPKESWKNVIKEYNVTGENVVHYNLPEDQQRAVENYLNVHGFPTYKLIDKQGNVLDVNADPRDLDALKNLLKTMTKE